MPTPRTIPAAVLLLAALALCGCGSGLPATGAAATASPATASGGAGLEATAATSTATTAAAVTAETHADAGDLEWDASAEVAVTLADGASAGGSGVRVDGDTVTVASPGTYRLRGTLTAGQVVVDTEDEGVVRLILDGVDVTSATTAPLSIANADEVVVILAEGSRNALADPATYTFASADATEPDAALFSTADLTIGGSGALVVVASYADGIVSKDGLVIAGGAIDVRAADDGIRGKDYLVIEDGTLTVDAGGDALKSTEEDDATLGYVAIAGGTLDLVAGSDAVDAFTTARVSGGTLTISAGNDGIHADTRLEIAGGSIDVARSYEGLEATQIVISGGATSVVAQDDGLNVAGGVDGSGWTQEGGFPGGGGGGGMPVETPIEGYFVEMSGGTLVIDAEGDGFDSNGSASVAGGTLVVNGPTSGGNGAIDVNGELLVSGGTIVAAGSAGMAETPSPTSAQPFVNLPFAAVQAAGTVVQVRAEDGTAIATFRASKAFQSLVVSTPALVAGAMYEVVTGGTASGDELGGLFGDPDAAGGTVIGSVTAEAGS